MDTDCIDGLSVGLWGQSLSLFHFGWLAMARSSSLGKEADQTGPVWFVERVGELFSVSSPPTSFLWYFFHLVSKARLVLKMGESFFLFPLGSPAVPQWSLPLLFLSYPGLHFIRFMFLCFVNSHVYVEIQM